MPELPEVETVRRGLLPAMEGRVIRHLHLARPDLRRPLPRDMKRLLTGARVERLHRRAKYLIADLSTGQSLIVHLGMSGRVLIAQEAPPQGPPPARALQKHDHVIFWLEGDWRVTYHDARRFGSMDLVKTEALETSPPLAGLGPEPLGNGFNPATLGRALEGRRGALKAALLDQRIVAGLGNIYVCEALHRAGLSPMRCAGALSEGEAVRLTQAVREVLRAAIAAGGSSLRDHRQANGDLGYFQHQFRVYGQEGAACPSPGCAGQIRREVQAGRSSFHCPECQR